MSSEQNGKLVSKLIMKMKAKKSLVSTLKRKKLCASRDEVSVKQMEKIHDRLNTVSTFEKILTRDHMVAFRIRNGSTNARRTNTIDQIFHSNKSIQPRVMGASENCESVASTKASRRLCVKVPKPDVIPMLSNVMNLLAPPSNRNDNNTSIFLSETSETKRTNRSSLFGNLSPIASKERKVSDPDENEKLLIHCQNTSSRISSVYIQLVHINFS